MMPTSYSIIGADASAELIERKSRFLATVRRVGEEDAARRVIEECRRTHRDAGHHCSAFALGVQAEITRSSDDGEPAGTAGMPILEAIRARGLSDVVVVVSRWFGGIKLGTGGLARAYGEAAAAGLAAAGGRERELVRHAEASVALDRIGRLDNDLRTRAPTLGLTVDGVDYGERARIALSVPAAHWSRAQALFAELGLDPAITGEGWRDR
ncbi:putative YigZ family protein [Naumannella cuiyingiana]|uniref:Putative YigZ family protein n=1 Tax=Naumannella cuiyingiana TaxID=1347891 RepID=A0A7Z0D920_9ACTN|nr:YigZ family protein [Naumannella cuiyingiana]NYI71183.1 putative YigZ family protein [Naumannella cuiyingiana]